MFSPLLCIRIESIQCTNIGVSEPPEKEKWGRDKVFLLVAVFVFLTVVVPLLIMLYVYNWLSRIH